MTKTVKDIAKETIQSCDNWIEMYEHIKENVDSEKKRQEVITLISESKSDKLNQEDKRKLLLITENGFGKKTKTKLYRNQTRGGKGVITYSLSSKTGDIIGTEIVSSDDEVMIITHEGIIIRTGVEDISTMGRATKGVRVMKMSSGDRVVSTTKVIF